MAMAHSHQFPMTPATITRTLIVSGFAILRVTRTPLGSEYLCERQDAFGAQMRYHLAFVETEPRPDDVAALRRAAEHDGRVLALITPRETSGSLSWQDFLDVCGGAVPSWRALDPGFPTILRTLASNHVPARMEGEAWRLFEEAVADGFEFALGRKVNRQGGRRRGEPVCDLLTQTPDDRVLIVDAKSSRGPFDVGEPALRPLREYVGRQSTRQAGQAPVSTVLIVAQSFEQSEARLVELAGLFLAEARLPLGFLTVDVLVHMIETLARRPDLRNALRWSRILCSGGPVSRDLFDRELNDAERERIRRDFW